MANLSFELPGGGSASATVDDAVLGMSVEDQAAFVDQVRATYLASNPQAAAGGSGQNTFAAAPGTAGGQALPGVPPPTADGWRMAPYGVSYRFDDPPAPADTSWSGALQHGVHGALAGLGASVKDLGAPSWGDAVTQAVPDRANYSPATQSLLAAARARSYAEAAGYLPRAAIEALPDVFGAGAAGLAGTALAGPVGGAAGIGTYAGARSFGDNVDDAATAAGRTAPTADDYYRGGALTAGEAALAALAPGVAGATGRVAGRATGALSGLFNRGVNAVNELPPATKALLYDAATEADRRRRGSPDESKWTTWTRPLWDLMNTVTGGGE